MHPTRRLALAPQQPSPAPRALADDSKGAADGVETVVTTIAMAATPERVWETLMFYEQVETRPPFHLRLLLPVPIRTEGPKSAVGDEALCLYEGGHLVKRVTEVESRRYFGFEVCKQELDVGGGMRLSGGWYELRELDGGKTEVAVATRYTSAKRPRWLWRSIEATVCHSFHRHILRAMRRDAEGREALVEGGTSA